MDHLLSFFFHRHQHTNVKSSRIYRKGALPISDNNLFGPFPFALRWIWYLTDAMSDNKYSSNCNRIKSSLPMYPIVLGRLGFALRIPSNESTRHSSNRSGIGHHHLRPMYSTLIGWGNRSIADPPPIGWVQHATTAKKYSLSVRQAWSVSVQSLHRSNQNHSPPTLTKTSPNWFFPWSRSELVEPTTYDIVPSSASISNCWRGV